LAKVVVPTYFIVALLDYSGLIAVIAHALKPVMALFGLPGEASVVLLSGWFLSVYSALGAMKALQLPPQAVTILALMILICHAIPLEWAVLHKMGARAWRLTLIRFLVSIIAGLIYAAVNAGKMPAFTVETQAIEAARQMEFFAFFAHSILGCAKLAALVFAVILPLSIISEWLRAKDLLPKLARGMSARLGRYNPGEGALVSLLIGLLIGVVYGGGAMIALARADIIKPPQARVVGLFLSLCHSILEDPVLFIAIGGSWFWLIVVRFLIAAAAMPLLRRWA
jgi:hypothetical protein